MVYGLGFRDSGFWDSDFPLNPRPRGLGFRNRA